MTSAVDKNEVDRFGAISDEWWNPKGKFRPLHQLNPPRLEFIRDQLLILTGHAANEFKPLSGLKVLDIGCGGGLISEPLCRLGAQVTGLDPSPEAIEAARAHAAAQALPVTYINGTAQDLAARGGTFDCVVAMEVIEHVPDAPEFLATCSSLTAPGGIFLLSTLNRTARSYALGIVAAEYILRWLPKGTHDWQRFIKPEELANMLVSSGFEVLSRKGLSFDPVTSAWRLSEDLGVNYLISARRPRA
jgi:2-polyprenyl-6-hydroxyphenyl methylase/3-demethylubiquinone-9 3-methyltransferase